MYRRIGLLSACAYHSKWKGNMRLLRCGHTHHRKTVPPNFWHLKVREILLSTSRRVLFVAITYSREFGLPLLARYSLWISKVATLKIDMLLLLARTARLSAIFPANTRSFAGTSCSCASTSQPGSFHRQMPFSQNLTEAWEAMQCTFTGYALNKKYALIYKVRLLTRFYGIVCTDV